MSVRPLYVFLIMTHVSFFIQENVKTLLHFNKHNVEMHFKDKDKETPTHELTLLLLYIATNQPS